MKPACVAERRRHQREPGRGLVLLFPSGVTDAFGAELVDVSSRGFRAIHTWRRARPGDTVRFRNGSKEGVARVIWTRIAGGEVESGFWIMEEH